MRNALFNSESPKQTVSLTLNSDLYAKAKSVGINASRVAEEALAGAYAAKQAEIIRAELQQDMRAISAYADQYGSFADHVRAHYDQVGDSV